MNGGKALLLDNPLGNQNRIFEVVTVPRHKGYEHVLSQSELSHIRGGSIRKYVTSGDNVPRPHQRALVYARVLIRAGVLDQVVDIHARFSGHSFGIIDAHHHACCIDRVNGPPSARDNGNPRVRGDGSFHTGTNERFLGTQRRDRLALHV